MLSGNYFYNATVKRIVSVFGTIFNNIKIKRHGSKFNTLHVPIAYGPRSKFLARIREESNLTDQKVALKLPRMSFELTSIDYDSTIHLNKLNKLTSGSNLRDRTTILQSVPYNIGMQLNIYAKNQDDVLQIVEQILPTFTPEYTVTIKEIEGPGSKTDVPFILNSISFQDDYEGDFTTRRAIIYTLDFTIKARFSAGAVEGQKIIKRVATRFADFGVSLTRVNTTDQSPSNFIRSDSPTAFSQVTVSSESPSQSPVRTFISFLDPDKVFTLTLGTSEPFDVGEVVIGSTSGNAGIILTKDGTTATADRLEGLFEAGETLVGQNSPRTSATLVSFS